MRSLTWVGVFVHLDPPPPGRQVCAHARTHTEAGRHTWTHTQAHTHTHRQAHTHTHTHRQAHTHIHAHTRTGTHPLMDIDRPL